MNFQDLLKELEALNLPTDQFAITSSGTLAVRNMREANDLDLIVTDHLWEQLCKKYPVNSNNNFQTIIIGNIQILGSGLWFTDPKFNSPEIQIENADLINGFRYVKLEIIKMIKSERNRTKDVQDLKLINHYVKHLFNS